MTIPSSQDLPFTKTLCFDLGTRTGWCLLQGGRIVGNGTFVLATPEELAEQRKQGGERTLDIRFSRLLTFILDRIAAGVDRIVFEDVQFAKTEAQVQVWTSLRCAIWAAAWIQPVKICCVQVGTLKRFATASGRAKKPDMSRALVDAEPSQYRLDENSGIIGADGSLIDDDQVDAIWLARFTAAADRGEQSFLSRFERKRAEKLLKRTKKAAARARRKARTQAAKVAAQARRKARPSRLRAKPSRECSKIKAEQAKVQSYEEPCKAMPASDRTQSGEIGENRLQEPTGGDPAGKESR